MLIEQAADQPVFCGATVVTRPPTHLPPAIRRYPYVAAFRTQLGAEPAALQGIYKCAGTQHRSACF